MVAIKIGPKSPDTCFEPPTPELSSRLTGTFAKCWFPRPFHKVLVLAKLVDWSCLHSLCIIRWLTWERLKMLTIDHLENIIHNHIKPCIHYLFFGSISDWFHSSMRIWWCQQKSVISAWKPVILAWKRPKKNVILWSLPSAWTVQDFLMQLAAPPLIAV